MTALPPSTDPLIDVRTAVPDAVLDVRYATPDNLTGRPLYPFAGAFLRRSTAEKLAKAARTLRAKGLRLVVYDAYRPLTAQKALWKAKPDPKYVADPAKGSSHNRAGAVDVGLADSAGEPLPMPTPFDELGPRAAHGAKGVPAAARSNAELLKAAMAAAGFTPLAEEWWHYKDPASKAWPLLDVPFEEIPK